MNNEIGKWPASITLIRHDVSAYNQLKADREINPLYLDFRQSFDTDPFSEKTKRLAELVQKKYRLGISDHATPLVETTSSFAEIMARSLARIIDRPDVVFVSPYTRTRATFKRMQIGWSELGNVKVYEDDRLRERERGLALLYNDWRVFHCLHPEQRMLYQQEGSYYYRFPQGENIPDMRERGRSMNTSWIREYAGKHVMAITHSEWIRGQVSNYLRLDAKGYSELDENGNDPINCGVTIFRCDPTLGVNGRLVLDRYNAKLY